MKGSYDHEIAELRAELIEHLESASYRELLEVRVTLTRLAGVPDADPLEGPRSLTPMEAGHVVYYLRWADRIKIGTTKNLRNRTRSIYFDEVLAAEPGGPGLEAIRHREFSKLRISGQREWFRAAPELMIHTAAIRSEHGAPFKVGKP